MKRLTIALGVLALALAGCRSVRYTNPSERETLTIDFGSTDLADIAEKMATSFLASPYLDNHPDPVIVVLPFRNMTSEHINTRAISQRIETALLKSGRVRFSATKELNQELLDQLKWQSSEMVDASTAARYGKMVGAQAVMWGELSSIEKKAGRTKQIDFLFTLRVAQVETGLYVFGEEKLIRKKETRGLFGL